MRVLVQSYGSRGDVEPYLALSCALNAAGHEAVLCAPEKFGSWISGLGVEFAPSTNAQTDMLAHPLIREIIEDNGKVKGSRADRQRKRRGLKEIKAQLLDEVLPTMMNDVKNAADDRVDLVVYRDLHAHYVAEWLGVPAVLTSLEADVVPSRYYPSGLVPAGMKLPKPLNLLSHKISDVLVRSSVVTRRTSRWRAAELGLPSRRGQSNMLAAPGGGPVTVLNALSAHLAPPAPDWPKWVHTTGFWELPTDPAWTPPRELERFLAEGEPPVFVGFGSIAGADPREKGRIVRAAIAAAGVRAVVVEGDGGVVIDEPDHNILVLQSVPYGWLLPRVRAAVHAGGTGTTHAVTAAGIPQLVVPFYNEQGEWGRQLSALGAAPEPVRQRDLTVDRLTAALRKIAQDERIASTARELGERVRAEDGTGTAVALLERVHHRTKEAV
ncbi:glycosyltransferase [Allokutzneria albata]|uniref:Sterol 3beta-glucosyltransferase n=1 Tax=Allokutzneria albata TaxID=211114 RepID=A0A1G9UEG9_ALLAB|nr:glycosyltransferase [Allokutzneria albata]SDM58341.1 sterol 3beta-glucosyltransferase [Allokutzneria albata]